MTKRKIVFYSAIIIILLAFISVGIVSFVLGNKYKNNTITFIMDNNKTYCNITGRFYYNDSEVVDTSYSPYNESYYPSAEYAPNGFKGFPVWDDLPDASFTGKGTEVYKYEIVITNLNENQQLNVELKNIIVGEDISDGSLLFYTTISYQLDEGEKNVKFSNKDEGVNLSLYQDNSRTISLVNNEQGGVDNSQNIPTGSKLKIIVEIERKTNTKKIDGDIYTNNFSIGLDTVENN